ncbi:hypothetical protein HOY80DRAFT_1136072 [Tuber brumale]|nr:hypothetical protein HOY80DRAFT_1136072 [Tuber brumale]
MSSHGKEGGRLTVCPLNPEGQRKGGRSLEFGSPTPAGNDALPHPSSGHGDTGGSINVHQDANNRDCPSKASDLASVPSAHVYPRAPLSEGEIDTSGETRRAGHAYQESSHYGSTGLWRDGREHPHGSNTRIFGSDFPDGRGSWVAVLGPNIQPRPRPELIGRRPEAFYDTDDRAVVSMGPRALRGTPSSEQGGIREDRYGGVEHAYNGPPPPDHYRQRSPLIDREDQPRRSRSPHRRVVSPHRPPDHHRYSPPPIQHNRLEYAGGFDNSGDYWRPSNYRRRHWDHGPRPQASPYTKKASTGDCNTVPRAPHRRFRSQSPHPQDRDRNPNFLDRPPQRRVGARGYYPRPQRYSKAYSYRPRSPMNPRELNPRHSHSPQENPRGAFRLTPYGPDLDAREPSGGDRQMGAATWGRGRGHGGSEDKEVASRSRGTPVDRESMSRTVWEPHQAGSETPKGTGLNKTPQHRPE